MEGELKLLTILFTNGLMLLSLSTGLAVTARNVSKPDVMNRSLTPLDVISGYLFGS